MTGAIILAAGSSSRMGQPKQQLIYKDKTLLEHTINAAINAELYPVVVVLGANYESIKAGIENVNIKILYNAAWQNGMSSSIKAGIDELNNHPKTQHVILTLCDQAFINSALLKKIVESKSTAPDAIIASFYGDTAGAPVLFSKRYFPELLKLNGDEGAKKLLVLHKEHVVYVPFPGGEIDIDTPGDYSNLTNASSGLDDHS